MMVPRLDNSCRAAPGAMAPVQDDNPAALEEAPRRTSPTALQGAPGKASLTQGVTWSDDGGGRLEEEEEEEECSAKRTTKAGLLLAYFDRDTCPWRMGFGKWIIKYFWDKRRPEPVNDESHELYLAEPTFVSTLLRNHRRAIGLVVPALVVHFFWWAVMIKHNLWYLFPERYILCITMIFASFLAGLTSIGGGTVAFPVLTLALHVSPSMARDFGLLIQSFGMTSATFTIMFMGVQIEWHAIVYCTLGGMIGLITGLELVEKHMSPSLKKMVFASFWFSFAFALFLLNRYRGRKTFPRIMIFRWWKAGVLLTTGIIGGIFTSFVGSGLDICSLSVLTLFFRVSEKQATPTSVVLMAVNSVLGLFWRQAIQTAVLVDTWKYVAVCACVVVIGAPMGSVLGTRFHRLVLAAIIYIIVGVTLITSFILVPQTPALIGISVSVILIGGILFLILTVIGQKVLSSELIETRMKRESFIKIFTPAVPMKVDEEDADINADMEKGIAPKTKGTLYQANGRLHEGSESSTNVSLKPRRKDAVAYIMHPATNETYPQYNNQAFLPERGMETSYGGVNPPVSHQDGGLCTRRRASISSLHEGLKIARKISVHSVRSETGLTLDMAMDSFFQAISTAQVPQGKVSLDQPQRTISLNTPQRKTSLSTPQREVSFNAPQQTMSLGTPQRRASFNGPQRKVSVDSPVNAMEQNKPIPKVSSIASMCKLLPVKKHSVTHM